MLLDVRAFFEEPEASRVQDLDVRQLRTVGHTSLEVWVAQPRSRKHRRVDGTHVVNNDASGIGVFHVE